MALIGVDAACLVSGLPLGVLALQLHEPLDVKRGLPGDDALIGIDESALVTSFAGAAEHASDDGKATVTIVQ